MLRFLLSSALLLCITTASAQTIVINPDKNHLPPSTAAAEQVRVSLSISMFVATSEDDGAQALKAQEDGRKMIYDAAAHECELLRAAIASECRLESININVQRVPANPNFNPNFAQRSGGYNINGSMTYRIGVK